MTDDGSTFGPTARRLAVACGLGMVAIGALVLVGWGIDSTLLKRISSGLPQMKPIAAVAIAAAGASIVLLAPAEGPGPRHRAGTICGLFAALIGITVIVEYLFGDLGINGLFFDDSGADPGRPTAFAAGALAIAGTSAATLDRFPPRHRLTLALQTVAAVAAVIAFVGFVYDVPFMRGRSGSEGVALHGTVALALGVMGLVLARPQRGLVAMLSGDDPASTFARRLAPVAIAVPLVLGALRLVGENLGLFGESLGLGIVTLGTIAILVGVIAVSARDVRTQARRGEAGERSFRAVTEALVEAIISADASGRIAYMNPAAELMFGRDGAASVGEPLTVLMPERYRDRHQSGIRRFLETKEPRIIGAPVELAGQRADGTEFPISLTLSAWEDASGTRFTAAVTDITSRLARQQETRELAAIVASSADAVIGWGLDRRVRSWNRGAERIYGYSADEMIGRSHDVLMPPGQVSELAELIERVRAGERIENHETARMRKDWRRIEVALTLSPIIDPDGRMVAVSTITRDISEHKAAQRKLAESARHFELINDLVATCGFDGYFKQLNGAWEQVLGWTPDELLPNPLLAIVLEEDREAAEAEVARQAGGGTTSEFKTRIKTKDGGWRWTEWSASPDVASGVFHCVGREISERMEVERALAAERRQLADAQQIASVGSWELDVVTGERTWSEQQYRNHGFDPGEPIPETERVLERIHPDDRAKARARMEDIAAGNHGFDYSYRVVLPDGRMREIETEGRPFVDEDGSIRVMGTSRDVTAERDAERLKDDFFGLISHELRTPLTSIIGYTELLAEIEADSLSEQGKRFIEVIERNSRRELSLVGDLLLLTKITAGTFEIELGRADLGTLAHAAAEESAPDATKAGVELTVDAEAAPVIDADPHRLAQVVDNLVSNAIKFTPKGGKVDIRAYAEGGQAVLAVADTGIGIPPEDTERLFERMFRAREAERRHIQGTGLGLTIVKAIVDAHGGSIGVESDIGRGTTVSVRLPLAAPKSAEPSANGANGVAERAAVEGGGA